MKLHRKIVLVTGGNSGIGRAIALRAAAEGARVAISGRDPTKGARVLAELETAGAEAAFIPATLGEEDAARLHEIEEEYRTGPLAARAQTGVTAICGRIEAELAELPPDDAREYLSSYGLKESGLERLISATYALLGLMSFLTAGETEVRAWTIPQRSPAVKAAGAIHSDFEKKFIRAEVVNWQALVDHKGYPGVRDKGLLRLEGKEYIVKDGDVLVIRHS